MTEHSQRSLDALLDRVADALEAGLDDLPVPLATDLIVLLGDRMQTGTPLPAPLLAWLLCADPELVVACSKVVAHSEEPKEILAFCEALATRHRAIAAGGGMGVAH